MSEHRKSEEELRKELMANADLRIDADGPPDGVRGTGWKMLHAMQVHDGNLVVKLTTRVGYPELKFTFSQAKTEELYRILKAEFER